MRDLSWRAYQDQRFSLVAFRCGSRVLDVGFGDGEHLRKLVASGCAAVGVEPNGMVVASARAEGLEVVEGQAEELPFGPDEFDGIVCSVVIPYTEERVAIREWVRVLRRDGEVRATYHGAGFFLRYLVVGGHWKRRVYGARTLMATWWYAATGKRLPGWVGDSLYQSNRRLVRYYKEFGLEVIEAPQTRSFWGFPVFISHRLRKT